MQPALLEGLSRFLVEHERCGQGFDISHPAGLGSGRVSIKCRACGARHEYATTTIEVEREIRIESREPSPAYEASRPRPSAPALPEPPALEPTPAPAPVEPPPLDGLRRVESPPLLGAAEAGDFPPGWSVPSRPGPPPGMGERLRALWTSRAATILLAVVSVGALAFAAIRVASSGGGEPLQHRGSAAVAPKPKTPPAAAPSGKPVVKQPAKPAARSLSTPHFSLTIPAGWIASNAGSGVLLKPRGGGSVRVQAYWARDPSLSRAQMEQQTTALLQSRNPGAAAGAPVNRTVGGAPGFEITAGPSRALGALRGAYRYLLVDQAEAGAPADQRRAAARIAASFTPH